MWVHVLRNASVRSSPTSWLRCRAFSSGRSPVERFFSIPGIGREVILAVERGDFPVIKAITVYVAVATMIFNLLADLMYKAAIPIPMQLK
jgi:peptide/nickel transport system permease protein